MNEREALGHVTDTSRSNINGGWKEDFVERVREVSWVIIDGI